MTDLSKHENAEPRNLEEFEYWLNCWADQPARDSVSDEWLDGYSQCIRDAMDALNLFYNAPYDKSWDEYQRRSQRRTLASTEEQP